MMRIGASRTRRLFAVVRAIDNTSSTHPHLDAVDDQPDAVDDQPEGFRRVIDDQPDGFRRVIDVWERPQDAKNLGTYCTNTSADLSFAFESLSAFTSLMISSSSSLSTGGISWLRTSRGGLGKLAYVSY